MEKRLQLMVWHRGMLSPLYYPIDKKQGWRINETTREIVVGRGVPRVLIPLDNVLSYSIEEY